MLASSHSNIRLFSNIATTNDTDFIRLIEEAKKIVGSRHIGRRTKCGQVACALMSDSGAIHTGINIDACSSVGFCAETAAIGSLIKTKEARIKKIVAYHHRLGVLTPCGKCRELIYQLNRQNISTKILLNSGKITTLEELLPEQWDILHYKDL